MDIAALKRYLSFYKSSIIDLWVDSKYTSGIVI